MATTANRQWCLARRPVGLVKESDFEWREGPVPVPRPGYALVRNHHLSLGPTDRQLLREEDTWLPAQRLGQVVRGVTVGTVVQSKNDSLPEGTQVMGVFGWQDFAVTDCTADFFMKLPDETQVPSTMHLGLFGPVGIAAYFGVIDIARPSAGEVMVVSAAGGATGSLVGQIAKLRGCRVVGITGSDEKCRWITEELGFDAAINYKKGRMFQGLLEHCPDGIDVYFDSVGGSILEDVLSVLKAHARVVACGMVSVYNDFGGTLSYPAGPNNLLNLVIKRGRIEGFVCLDYWNRASEAFAALADWQQQGKIRYRVEVVEGLRNAPRALNQLFDGSNRGKLVLEI